MMKRARWLWAFAVLGGLAWADELDVPEAGADTPSLLMPMGPDDVSSIPEVGEKMEEFIAAKEIAGSVTLLADKEGILHLQANGFSNIETKTPMDGDALFWIASMTKPVTGTAVMMMQEAGLLSVEDQVSKHLPEFRKLKDAKGKPVEVTIRQLLTHSSGLSELSPEEARRITTLAELSQLVVEKPVQFEPGSKWKYCQTGINTAGRIVEVLSGQSFPKFLEERLFGPLGMKDTTFYPTEAQAKRLATSYRLTDGGVLEEAEVYMLGGKLPTDRNRYPMANGGLFSTAKDYARFCRMILNGGELARRRYLKPESVQQMTTVQSWDLETGFTPGNGWGPGWCVVREPQGVSSVLSPGSFGHGGAYGTQAWIDPTKERIYLLMVQRANFKNSDDSPVRKGFQEAAAKVE
ncbi:serine hydrolase domain-containing protein [Haloferula chungangensis]|uniref:Serine hydrolase domain-containing protein n=1 Tax=Haloferula chungangensis TaxID=1048331 RepID=A0ABW2LAY0_9BACT